jgi:hypothetical protein
MAGHVMIVKKAEDGDNAVAVVKVAEAGDHPTMAVKIAVDGDNPLRIVRLAEAGEAFSEVVEVVNPEVLAQGGIDEYTVLALHLDAATGTALVDASATGAAVTMFGTASIADTDAKASFGKYMAVPVNSGAYYDGTVVLPGLFDGDFVIDTWFRFDDGMVNKHGIFTIGYKDTSLDTDSRNFGLMFDAPNGRFTLAYGSGSATLTFADSGVAAGTWYHVAVVRSEDTVRLFRDGAQKGTTQTLAIRATSYPANCNVGTYPSNALRGKLDEFRISIGTDRDWADGFTPPASPYTVV